MIPFNPATLESRSLLLDWKGDWRFLRSFVWFNKEEILENQDHESFSCSELHRGPIFPRI